MPERSRWSAVIVVVAALVLAGCRTDPYEGWPDPATLGTMCDRFKEAEDAIVAAMDPDDAGTWDEARASVGELAVAVEAADLPTPGEAPSFPDLTVAVDRMARGVEEAEGLTELRDQFDATFGPIKPIDPHNFDPTIDPEEEPHFAFFAACQDHADTFDDPIESSEILGMAAVLGAFAGWLMTRRRDAPAARTAHTILGGVLLGTAAVTLLIVGAGIVMFVQEFGGAGLWLAVASVFTDSAMPLATVSTGGLLGAFGATIVAWRRARRRPSERTDVAPEAQPPEVE